MMRAFKALLYTTAIVVAVVISSTLAISRDEIIVSVIQEVKLSELLDEVQMQEQIEPASDSPGQLLRAFKRASKEAIAIGEAQIRFEKMVRKAEKKIVEIQKLNNEEMLARAESIANLMVQPPGTIITPSEVTKIAQEAGCTKTTATIPDCSLNSNQFYRTPTGVCNNIKNPLYGAAHTQFRRLIPSQYEDGFNQLRGTMQSRDSYFYFFQNGPYQPPNPSPRVVSTSVIEDEAILDARHSHILMQWGQFIDHDLDLAPAFMETCKDCKLDEKCVPIRVPESDAIFGVTGQANVCHEFPRSIPVCNPDALNGIIRPREQLNEINSFIDGSQVYGSSQEVFDALREEESGLLRTGSSIPATGKPSLPIDTNKFVECMRGSGCFLAGDVRVNEQTGLLIMHTIWVREHNRIATLLQKQNPSWNSERVFQTARAIVGAEIQKITFKDYLPIILGDAMSLIGDYKGYNDSVNPSIPNGFATAAFRFGHSQINHEFLRLDENYESMSIGPLSLLDSFFDPSQFEKSGGTDPILRGLLTSSSQKVDKFVNNVLTNHLFQTSGSSHGMDLASLNIQRGRDHGLPPYLTWRRWAEEECKLSGFFESTQTHLNLLNTYGSLETVDLWVGGLAEGNVPGGLVGPTFACILSKTFQALRDGDRFYYENSDSRLFTNQQIAEIEKASLSRIICDNSDGISSIQPNAFFANQQRSRCSSGYIPQVNIALWTETSTCYIKALVLDGAVNLYTHSSMGDLSTTTYQYGEICIPFTCPSKSYRTVIVTLTGTLASAGNSCKITSHTSRSTQLSYTAVGSYGQLNRNGIYNSIDRCRNARSNANFSIRCNSYTSTSTIMQLLQGMLDDE